MVAMSKEAHTDEGLEAPTRLDKIVQRLRGLLRLRKHGFGTEHQSQEDDYPSYRSASLGANFLSGEFLSTKNTQGTRRHHKRLRPSQRRRLQKLRKALITKAERRAQHQATQIVDWEERLTVAQFGKIDDGVRNTISRHMHRCIVSTNITFSCDVINKQIKKLEEASLKVSNFAFLSRGLDTKTANYVAYVKAFVRDVQKRCATQLDEGVPSFHIEDDGFYCPSLDALVKRLHRISLPKANIVPQATAEQRWWQKIWRQAKAANAAKTRAAQREAKCLAEIMAKKMAKKEARRKVLEAGRPAYLARKAARDERKRAYEVRQAVREIRKAEAEQRKTIAAARREIAALEYQKRCEVREARRVEAEARKAQRESVKPRFTEEETKAFLARRAKREERAKFLEEAKKTQAEKEKAWEEQRDQFLAVREASFQRRRQQWLAAQQAADDRRVIKQQEFDRRKQERVASFLAAQAKWYDEQYQRRVVKQHTKIEEKRVAREETRLLNKIFLKQAPPQKVNDFASVKVPTSCKDCQIVTPLGIVDNPNGVFPGQQRIDAQPEVRITLSSCEIFYPRDQNVYITREQYAQCEKYARTRDLVGSSVWGNPFLVNSPPDLNLAPQMSTVFVDKLNECSGSYREVDGFVPLDCCDRALVQSYSCDVWASAGFAKTSAKRYPVGFRHSLRCVEPQIGHAYPYKNLFGSDDFCLMTKRRSNMRTSNLFDVSSALMKLGHMVPPGTRLMMPMIETGCNKHKWEDIKPLVEVHLKHCDVLVYSGKQACSDSSTQSFRKFILDLMATGLDGIDALPDSGTIRYMYNDKFLMIYVDKTPNGVVFVASSHCVDLNLLRRFGWSYFCDKDITQFSYKKFDRISNFDVPQTFQDYEGLRRVRSHQVEAHVANGILTSFTVDYVEVSPVGYSGLIISNTGLQYQQFLCAIDDNRTLCPYSTFAASFVGTKYQDWLVTRFTSYGDISSHGITSGCGSLSVVLIPELTAYLASIFPSLSQSGTTYFGDLSAVTGNKITPCSGRGRGRGFVRRTVEALESGVTTAVKTIGSATTSVADIITDTAGAAADTVADVATATASTVNSVVNRKGRRGGRMSRGRGRGRSSTRGQARRARGQKQDQRARMNSRTTSGKAYQIGRSEATLEMAQASARSVVQTTISMLQNQMRTLTLAERASHALVSRAGFQSESRTLRKRSAPGRGSSSTRGRGRRMRAAARTTVASVTFISLLLTFFMLICLIPVAIGGQVFRTTGQVNQYQGNNGVWKNYSPESHHMYLAIDGRVWKWGDVLKNYSAITPECINQTTPEFKGEIRDVYNSRTRKTQRSVWNYMKSQYEDIPLTHTDVWTGCNVLSRRNKQQSFERIDVLNVNVVNSFRLDSNLRFSTTEELMKLTERVKEKTLNNFNKARIVANQYRERNLTWANAMKETEQLQSNLERVCEAWAVRTCTPHNIEKEINSRMASLRDLLEDALAIPTVAEEEINATLAIHDTEEETFISMVNYLRDVDDRAADINAGVAGLPSPVANATVWGTKVLDLIKVYNRAMHNLSATIAAHQARFASKINEFEDLYGKLLVAEKYQTATEELLDQLISHGGRAKRDATIQTDSLTERQTDDLIDRLKRDLSSNNEVPVLGTTDDSVSSNQTVIMGTHSFLVGGEGIATSMVASDTPVLGGTAYGLDGHVLHNMIADSDICVKSDPQDDTVWMRNGIIGSTSAGSLVSWACYKNAVISQGDTCVQHYDDYRAVLPMNGSIGCGLAYTGSFVVGSTVYPAAPSGNRTCDLKCLDPNVLWTMLLDQPHSSRCWWPILRALYKEVNTTPSSVCSSDVTVYDGFIQVTYVNNMTDRWNVSVQQNVFCCHGMDLASPADDRKTKVGICMCKLPVSQDVTDMDWMEYFKYVVTRIGVSDVVLLFLIYLIANRFTSPILAMIFAVLIAYSYNAYADDCGARGSVIPLRGVKGDNDIVYSAMVTVQKGDCIVLGRQKIIVQSIVADYAYASAIKLPMRITAFTGANGYGCCAYLWGKCSSICEMTDGCASKSRGYGHCDNVGSSGFWHGHYVDCLPNNDVWVYTSACFTVKGEMMVYTASATPTNVKMVLSMIDEEGKQSTQTISMGSGYYTDALTISNFIPSTVSRPSWIGVVDKSNYYCGTLPFNAYGTCTCPVDQDWSNCLTETCLDLKWKYDEGNQHFSSVYRAVQAYSFIGPYLELCNKDFSGVISGNPLSIAVGSSQFSIHSKQIISNVGVKDCPANMDCTLSVAQGQTGTFSTSSVGITCKGIPTCKAVVTADPCTNIGSSVVTLTSDRTVAVSFLCGTLTTRYVVVGEQTFKLDSSLTKSVQHAVDFKVSAVNWTNINSAWSGFFDNINIAGFSDIFDGVLSPIKRIWNMINSALTDLVFIFVGLLLFWMGLNNNNLPIMIVGLVIAIASYAMALDPQCVVETMIAPEPLIAVVLIAAFFSRLFKFTVHPMPIFAFIIWLLDSLLQMLNNIILSRGVMVFVSAMELLINILPCILSLWCMFRFELSFIQTCIITALISFIIKPYTFRQWHVILSLGIGCVRNGHIHWITQALLRRLRVTQQPDEVHLLLDFTQIGNYRENSGLRRLRVDDSFIDTILSATMVACTTSTVTQLKQCEQHLTGQCSEMSPQDFVYCLRSLARAKNSKPHLNVMFVFDNHNFFVSYDSYSDSEDNHYDVWTISGHVALSKGLRIRNAADEGWHVFALGDDRLIIVGLKGDDLDVPEFDITPFYEWYTSRYLSFSHERHEELTRSSVEKFELNRFGKWFVTDMNIRVVSPDKIDNIPSRQNITIFIDDKKITNYAGMSGYMFSSMIGEIYSTFLINQQLLDQIIVYHPTIERFSCVHPSLSLVLYDDDFQPKYSDPIKSNELSVTAVSLPVHKHTISPEYVKFGLMSIAEFKVLSMCYIRAPWFRDLVRYMEDWSMSRLTVSVADRDKIVDDVNRGAFTGFDSTSLSVAPLQMTMIERAEKLAKGLNEYNGLTQCDRLQNILMSASSTVYDVDLDLLPYHSITLHIKYLAGYPQNEPVYAIRLGGTESTVIMGSKMAIIQIPIADKKLLFKCLWMMSLYSDDDIALYVPSEVDPNSIVWDIVSTCFAQSVTNTLWLVHEDLHWHTIDHCAVEQGSLDNFIERCCLDETVTADDVLLFCNDPKPFGWDGSRSEENNFIREIECPLGGGQEVVDEWVHEGVPNFVKMGHYTAIVVAGPLIGRISGVNGNSIAPYHVTEGQDIEMSIVHSSEQITKYVTKCVASDKTRDESTYGEGVTLTQPEFRDICVAVDWTTKRLTFLARLDVSRRVQIAGGVYRAQTFKPIERVGKNWWRYSHWNGVSGCSGMAIYVMRDGKPKLCSVYTGVHHSVNRTQRSVILGVQSGKMNDADMYFEKCARTIMECPLDEDEKAYLVSAPTGAGKTVRLVMKLLEYCINEDKKCHIVVGQITVLAVMNAFKMYKKISEEKGFGQKALIKMSIGADNAEKMGAKSHDEYGYGNAKFVVEVLTYGLWKDRIGVMRELAQRNSMGIIEILDEFHTRKDDNVIDVHATIFQTDFSSKKIFLSATPCKLDYVKHVNPNDETVAAPFDVQSECGLSSISEDKIKNFQANSFIIDGRALKSSNINYQKIFIMPKDWILGRKTLIFVHSKAACERLAKSIQELNPGSKNIYCLWSGSDLNVFDLPSNAIIISTNVAESAITIPDLEVEINFGLEMREVYKLDINLDPEEYIRELKEVSCSSCSNKQRRGRIGRTCEGRYVEPVPLAGDDIEIWPLPQVLLHLLRLYSRKRTAVTKIIDMHPDEDYRVACHEVRQLLPDMMAAHYNTGRTEGSAEYWLEKFVESNKDRQDPLFWYLSSSVKENFLRKDLYCGPQWVTRKKLLKKYMNFYNHEGDMNPPELRAGKIDMTWHTDSHAVYKRLDQEFESNYKEQRLFHEAMGVSEHHANIWLFALAVGAVGVAAITSMCQSDTSKTTRQVIRICGVAENDFPHAINECQLFDKRESDRLRWLETMKCKILRQLRAILINVNTKYQHWKNMLKEFLQLLPILGKCFGSDGSHHSMNIEASNFEKIVESALTWLTAQGLDATLTKDRFLLIFGGFGLTGMLYDQLCSVFGTHASWFLLAVMSAAFACLTSVNVALCGVFAMCCIYAIKSILMHLCVDNRIRPRGSQVLSGGLIGTVLGWFYKEHGGQFHSGRRPPGITETPEKVQDVADLFDLLTRGEEQHDLMNSGLITATLCYRTAKAVIMTGDFRLDTVGKSNLLEIFRRRKVDPYHLFYGAAFGALGAVLYSILARVDELYAEKYIQKTVRDRKDEDPHWRVIDDNAPNMAQYVDVLFSSLAYMANPSSLITTILDICFRYMINATGLQVGDVKDAYIRDAGVNPKTLIQVKIIEFIFKWINGVLFDGSFHSGIVEIDSDSDTASDVIENAEPETFIKWLLSKMNSFTGQLRNCVGFIVTLCQMVKDLVYGGISGVRDKANEVGEAVGRGLAKGVVKQIVDTSVEFVWGVFHGKNAPTLDRDNLETRDISYYAEDLKIYQECEGGNLNLLRFCQYNEIYTVTPTQLIPNEILGIIRNNTIEYNAWKPFFLMRATRLAMAHFATHHAWFVDNMGMKVDGLGGVYKYSENFLNIRFWTAMENEVVVVGFVSSKAAVLVYSSNRTKEMVRVWGCGDLVQCHLMIYGFSKQLLAKTFNVDGEVIPCNLQTAFMDTNENLETIESVLLKHFCRTISTDPFLNSGSSNTDPLIALLKQPFVDVAQEIVLEWPISWINKIRVFNAKNYLLRYKITRSHWYHAIAVCFPNLSIFGMKPQLNQADRSILVPGRGEVLFPMTRVIGQRISFGTGIFSFDAFDPGDFAIKFLISFGYQVVIKNGKTTEFFGVSTNKQVFFDIKNGFFHKGGLFQTAPLSSLDVEKCCAILINLPELCMDVLYGMLMMVTTGTYAMVSTSPFRQLANFIEAGKNYPVTDVGSSAYYPQSIFLLLWLQALENGDVSDRKSVTRAFRFVSEYTDTHLNDLFWTKFSHSAFLQCKEDGRIDIWIRAFMNIMVRADLMDRYIDQGSALEQEPHVLINIGFTTIGFNPDEIGAVGGSSVNDDEYAFINERYRMVNVKTKMPDIIKGSYAKCHFQELSNYAVLSNKDTDLDYVVDFVSWAEQNKPLVGDNFLTAEHPHPWILIDFARRNKGVDMAKDMVLFIDSAVDTPIPPKGSCPSDVIVGGVYTPSTQLVDTGDHKKNKTLRHVGALWFGEIMGSDYAATCYLRDTTRQRHGVSILPLDSCLFLEVRQSNKKDKLPSGDYVVARIGADLSYVALLGPGLKQDLYDIVGKHMGSAKSTIGKIRGKFLHLFSEIKNSVGLGNGQVSEELSEEDFIPQEPPPIVMTVAIPDLKRSKEPKSTDQPLRPISKIPEPVVAVSDDEGPGESFQILADVHQSVYNGTNVGGIAGGEMEEVLPQPESDKIQFTDEGCIVTPPIEKLLVFPADEVKPVKGETTDEAVKRKPRRPRRVKGEKFGDEHLESTKAISEATEVAYQPPVKPKLPDGFKKEDLTKRARKRHAASMKRYKDAQARYLAEKKMLTDLDAIVPFEEGEHHAGRFTGSISDDSSSGSISYGYVTGRTIDTTNPVIKVLRGIGQAMGVPGKHFKETVVDPVKGVIDSVARYTSFEPSPEEMEPYQGLIAEDLIVKTRLEPPPVDGFLNINPMGERGFYTLTSSNYKDCANWVGNVTLGELIDDVTSLLQKANAAAHHLTGPEWELVKNMGRIVLPDRIVNTKEYVRDYHGNVIKSNVKTIYASKAALKAQQLYEKDPVFFSDIKKVWVPACGYGGETQFFSHIWRDRTDCVVYFNTLIRTGHCAPHCDQMVVAGSKVKVVDIRNNEQTGGDIRDDSVYQKFVNLVDCYREFPDLIFFDLGETDDNMETEERWLFKKKQDVSVYDACKRLINLLPKNGKVVFKLLGITKRTPNLLQDLFGKFTKFRVIRVRSASVFSHEYYILASRFNPYATSMPIQVMDMLAKCVAFAWRESLKDNVPFLQYICDITSTMPVRVTGEHSKITKRMRLLQAKMLENNKKPLTYDGWFQPTPGGAFSVLTAPDVSPEANQMGFHVAPRGQKNHFETRGGTFSFHWEPKWLIRFKQICRDAPRRVRMRKYQRNWSHIHGIGSFKDVKPVEKVVGSTNGLVKSCLEKLCGMNLDNCTVGHTQNQRTFLEQSIKKRIDCIVSDTNPEWKIKLVECIDTMFTDYGKEQYGTCRILEEDEVRVMINNKGAGGILDRDGTLEQYIKNNPDWYRDIIGQYDKLKRSKPNEGDTRGTGTHWTLRFKNEPKKKKCVDEEGRIDLSMVESGEGAAVLKNPDRPALSDYNHMVPRFITYADARTRLAHVIYWGDLLRKHHTQKLYKGSCNGLPPYLVGRLLARVWNLVDKEENAIPDNTPAMGMKVTFEGNYDRNDLGSPLVAAGGIEQDYSNWDATVNIFMRQLEFYAFRRFFPKHMWPILENQVIDACFPFVFDDLGEAFVRAGMRGSGEIWTSIGNTLLCAAVLRAVVADILGKPIEWVNETVARVAVQVEKFQERDLTFYDKVTKTKVINDSLDFYRGRYDPNARNMNPLLFVDANGYPCDDTSKAWINKNFRSTAEFVEILYKNNKGYRSFNLSVRTFKPDKNNRPIIDSPLVVGESYQLKDTIISVIRGKRSQRNLNNAIIANAMNEAIKLAKKSHFDKLDVPFGSIGSFMSHEILLSSLNKACDETCGKGLLYKGLALTRSFLGRSNFKVLLWSEQPQTLEVKEYTVVKNCQQDESEERLQMDLHFEEQSDVYWKVYEIPRIPSFNDGDDSIIIAKLDVCRLYAAEVSNRLKMIGPAVRYGNKSGVKCTDRFTSLNFCSNSYQPIYLNRNSIAPSVRDDKKRLIEAECGVFIKDCYREAVDQGFTLWYLPYRPVSDILGKLLCSLKRVTQVWDPSNPETVDLTRSKVTSFLLMYPHIRIIRLVCISLLAVIGDGKIEMYEKKRRFGEEFFPVSKTILGALYSIYGVLHLDSIGYVRYSVEKKAWDVIRYNANLNGFTAFKNIGEAQVLATSWLASFPGSKETSILRLWPRRGDYIAKYLESKMSV